LDLIGRLPAAAQAVSSFCCFCINTSMLRYRLVDQVVPAMWRSLAAARLRQDWPSGNAPEPEAWGRRIGSGAEISINKYAYA